MTNIPDFDPYTVDRQFTKNSKNSKNLKRGKIRNEKMVTEPDYTCSHSVASSFNNTMRENKMRTNIFPENQGTRRRQYYDVDLCYVHNLHKQPAKAMHKQIRRLNSQNLDLRKTFSYKNNEFKNSKSHFNKNVFSPEINDSG